ncbi:MAG: SIMPL domain-containing protein [Marinovum sp.]|nr:SIMPL domain-containing protein [Marinovum sp.]
MRLGTVMAFCLLVWAQTVSAQDGPPQLVVTGVGTTRAVPDMAIVSLGVTAEDRVAQKAMDGVSEQIRAVFGAVVELGVAPEDVQTSALRLDPLWSNRSSVSGAGPEIRGFVATNDIILRLRDMTQLGEALQKILEAGANRIGSIQFTLADPKPVQDKARRAAVAEARRKAELYADAAGETLGPILTIIEGGGGAPRPMMMADARMASSPAMPVAGGELDITAQVTITYALGN